MQDLIGNQGQGAVVLGSEAGESDQGNKAVVTRNYAGETTQGAHCYCNR